MTTIPPAAPAGQGAVPPVPGWYDDPEGRHRYRWWDGALWTSQVSDGIDVGDDPLGDRRGRRGRAVAVSVAAVLAALALVGGLAAVYLAAPSERSCITSDLTVDGDLSFATFDERCVDLAAGAAVRVRLEPLDDQDVVLALSLPDDVVTGPFFAPGAAGGSPLPVEGAEVLFDGDLADAEGRDDVGTVVRVADDRGDGEAEATFLPPLPFDVELTVIAAGYQGESGDYRLTIELLDPSPSFDPSRYPDIERYEDEFLDSVDYETYYAPFFDGAFFEP